MTLKSDAFPFERRCRFLLSSVTLCLLLCVGASAHQLGQSYIFLSVYDEELGVRIEITERDLSKAIGVKVDSSTEELSPHVVDRIKTYFEKRLEIKADGEQFPLRFTHHSTRKIEVADYVLLHFKMKGFARRPRELEIYYAALFETDPQHRGLLVIQHNWKAGTLTHSKIPRLVFRPDQPRQKLEVESGSVWRGFLTFLHLGLEHIGFGIDHVLFLLALILPGVVRRKRSPLGEGGHLENTWEPVAKLRPALVYVVKIVTLFTIAHSVTLSLAALDIVRLPSRLVESVIAVSIAVAAVDILIPIFRGRVWLIVFVFGLFHGFGFAAILVELGIPSNYMIHSLLAFNLGVEVGQVVIIALLLPILYSLRKQGFYLRYVLKLGAILLVLISLYWFVERALDVDLPAGAWLISALRMVS